MKNYKGLTNSEVLESRAAHGENRLTPPKKTPWYILFLEKFKDPIIVILLVAAAISIVVGFFQGSFIESVGIIVAIGLATGVSFWMEYSSKKKFDILNQVSDTEPVKVIREGNVTEIPKTEVVIGDIVILETGAEIPADIDLLEALELKVDESSMTGESMPASKQAKTDEEGEYTGSGFAPWFVLRSTKITEGTGVGVVVKIGDETEIGKTSRAAMEEVDEETPLNKQLNGLADLINKAAFSLAGLLLLFLNVHHFVFTDFDPSFMAIFTEEVKYLMMALALVICAVPEGMPLASTLSLAFAMDTMRKQNNLIKKLHACETIGCTNIIFSDKTGTLTQNKMVVVDTDLVNKEKLFINAAINSTANLDESGEALGNPTEGATLKFLKSEGTDYREHRRLEVIDQKPFNSTDKYMSTTVKDGTIYVKGAPEIVAGLAKDNSYLEKVEEQQAKGRRVLSFASGNSMDTLTYDGSVFIEDPVRVDVPQAVKDCYHAGINVVMMTGDNIKTAAEIGRQAGFKKDETTGKVWAIEAKEFDNIDWNNNEYPTVIARCKPSDKLNILKSFQEKYKGTDDEFVCAMTGDGVNDSPSLNHANIGIAMGSGTSVAKESADIVLLDDAFPSIVTGVKWGRSLYKNIQSFLTFQLIINVAVCFTVLVGPLLGIDLPFTVTQLLWVNIAMDTLAAICLATEKADPNVMDELPRKQTEFIITGPMYKTIFGMGILVFLILSSIIYDISHNSSAWFGLDLTGLFATFLMICCWNIFNIRVFRKNHSIFYGLGTNKYFLIGTLVLFVGTVLIVEFGGEVFNTHPLSVTEWAKIIAATSIIAFGREAWYWVKKLL